MSLKRSAESPCFQPCSKKRKLNPSITQLTINNQNNTTGDIPYYNYHHHRNKHNNKCNNNNYYDKFVSSIDKINYLSGHRGCINSICWEKSGKICCTGSDDTTIRIWDPFSQNNRKSQQLCVLMGHLSNVFSAKFMYNSSVSGINNYVCSGGNDANLNIYDINHHQSLFIKPLYSYYHHSRKILKIAVHSQKVHQVFSCSSDGTIRHFDIRKQYKKNNNCNNNDVIIQGFGGGPRYYRGYFKQSLLYDFNNNNNNNEHLEIYSIDINPIKSYELLTSCNDGFIRIFDLRNHSKYINNCNTSGFNKNTSISTFYNQRIKFPKYCHPTDAIYNYDGSEILTTHIHDACYVFINPTNVSNDTPNSNTNKMDAMLKIKAFIDDSDDDHDDVSPSTPINPDRNKMDELLKLKAFMEDSDDDDVVGPSTPINSDSEDDDLLLEKEYSQFLDLINFAFISKIATKKRNEMFNNINNINNSNINDLIPAPIWSNLDVVNDTSHDNSLDDDILDYAETLRNRRNELLMNNVSESELFKDVLLNLLQNKEKILQILTQKNKNIYKKQNILKYDNLNNKIMKFGMNSVNNDINEINLDNLPPINSNIDIINYYHNKYYAHAYFKYSNDNKMNNINGMIIGEEAELHYLDSNKYNYFGKYIGHIHCETIKGCSYFGNNYIISGSDDKYIYIYNKLNGDIVNILNNKTNIVNNIATHPNLPIFLSAGLDKYVTIWGPKYWNNEDNHDNYENEDNAIHHQQQMKYTQKVVDNVFCLRCRVGFDIL